MHRSHSLAMILTPLITGASVSAAGRIVITEIMYDPDSHERQGETEWVEIANVGDEPIEIRNWRLDDEDKTDWGPISCDLLPGGVAVLVNKAFVTEEKFRAAWDPGQEAPPPPGASESAPVREAKYQIIPVAWSSLANTPDAQNEMLALINAEGKIICEVNLQESGDWPEVSGASIWLSDLAASDFNQGILWKPSVSGADGAWTSRAFEIFNRPDVGSPGFVPGLTAAGIPLAHGEPNPVPPPPANANEEEDDIIDY